ncbi:TRAP transporter small permease [Primorskyibacter sp. 2E107]|uniref:TRAP transporter small permease n=1 Tax=Primorskyibacter sp. 2E107 TaxID=3403458 RepID=UPI003AF70DE6
MKRVTDGFTRLAEGLAALMMALMFGTFILQVAVRYTARLDWVAEAVPLFDPSRYGWTLEFCLALWVWIVFWGNATIVRERDHVTFDLLYLSVNPRLRRGFAVISAVAICAGLLWSLEPTWSKFYILRLKKTATLSNVFGDWIRMRDIYSVYAFFLVAVSLRYALRAWKATRHGVEDELHGFDAPGEGTKR